MVPNRWSRRTDRGGQTLSSAPEGDDRVYPVRGRVAMVTEHELRLSRTKILLVGTFRSTSYLLWSLGTSSGQ